MFEPYIHLACLLNKRVIVISDNDKMLSETKETSTRFKNLKELCTEKKIKLIEVENTLETDLYNNGYLENCKDLLKTHEKHLDYYISKEKKKIEIVERLIMQKTNLEDWHVIKEIKNEFSNH